MIQTLIYNILKMSMLCLGVVTKRSLIDEGILPLTLTPPRRAIVERTLHRLQRCRPYPIHLHSRQMIQTSLYNVLKMSMLSLGVE